MILDGLPQRISESNGCRESLAWLLLQGSGQESLDAAGHLSLRVLAAQRRHGIPNVRPHGLHGRLILERRNSGQHLVKHDGQRVQVAGRDYRITQGLLRAQVLRSTNDHPGQGQRLHRRIPHELRNPEIHHLDHFTLVTHHYEQVVRLEIPVQDAKTMGLLERVTHVQHKLSRPGNVQRSLLPDEPRQRLPP